MDDLFDETAQDMAVDLTRRELRHAAASWAYGEDGSALEHVLAALDTYIETLGLDERFWRVLTACTRVLEAHGHHNAAIAALQYFESIACGTPAPTQRDPVWDQLLGLSDESEFVQSATDRDGGRLLLAVSG